MKTLSEFIIEKLVINKNTKINNIDYLIDKIFNDNSLGEYFTWSGSVNLRYILESIISEHAGPDLETYDLCIERLNDLYKNLKLQRIDDNIIVNNRNEYFNWWYGEDNLPEQVKEIFNYEFNDKLTTTIDFDDLLDLEIKIVNLNQYILVYSSTYDIDISSVIIFVTKKK